VKLRERVKRDVTVVSAPCIDASIYVHFHYTTLHNLDAQATDNIFRRFHVQLFNKFLLTLTRKTSAKETGYTRRRISWKTRIFQYGMRLCVSVVCHSIYSRTSQDRDDAAAWKNACAYIYTIGWSGIFTRPAIVKPHNGYGISEITKNCFLRNSICPKTIGDSEMLKKTGGRSCCSRTDRTYGFPNVNRFPCFPFSTPDQKTSSTTSWLFLNCCVAVENRK